MVEATVLTWNLHGSSGVDVTAVAEVIRAAHPDLVALQEVQRRQVTQLAAAFSMPSKRWAFKHWPFTARPEGLAVLSPHRIVGADRFRLRRGWFWSWKRRVGIDVTIDAGGRMVRVLDVHLTSHDDEAQRVREASTLVRRARKRQPAPIIVGDLNDGPDRSAPAELVAAGWVDGWAAVHAPDELGATNWTAGDRMGRAPTQRLDYVFAPPGSAVLACTIPIAGDDLDRAGRLSDHLPVAATVHVP
jgi:endonuclease/exonuclease/phosphatase family metal-dependent hydrolase